MKQQSFSITNAGGKFYLFRIIAIFVFVSLGFYLCFYVLLVHFGIVFDINKDHVLGLLGENNTKIMVFSLLLGGGILVVLVPFKEGKKRAYLINGLSNLVFLYFSYAVMAMFSLIMIPLMLNPFSISRQSLAWLETVWLLFVYLMLLFLSTTLGSKLSKNNEL